MLIGISMSSIPVALLKAREAIIGSSEYCSTSIRFTKDMLNMSNMDPVTSSVISKRQVAFSFILNNAFSSEIQFACADLNFTSLIGSCEITVRIMP